ncbi:MAG: hypothetical protein QOH28_2330 [Actinomycetota bacterium]|jgi:hypothetical protein|nr:hypothetical protein [Actinomycetota bacterium]
MKGVSCVQERPFNPLRNVAPDAIEYRVPDGRTCNLPSGLPLYVIVYDTLPHRVTAVEHGEAQLNLCSFSAKSGHASDSWSALAAANWRAATPGSAQALADLRIALGGTAEPEMLSCQFRS